jgi:transposase
MGARKLSMHRLQDLVRLHRQGRTVRAIAQLLRMGRNTIARYRMALASAGLLDGAPDHLPELGELKSAVERHEATRRRPAAQQQSSIERWLGIVDAKHHAGVGPTAIFDFLRLGYPDEFDGSLSAIKRRCAHLKRIAPVSVSDVVIPVETDLGEEAQVDFGYVGKLYDATRGVMRKAWVFVMTLSCSRKFVARIVFDQTVETWVRAHIECFQELGGVPRRIVPDNLKAAVIRAAFGIDGETTLNRTYRELARAYDFVIDPTPPRSPEKKGKVEASVRYLKNNFFKAVESEDVRVVRAELQRWIQEIADTRRHGTTARRPGEVFRDEEQARLLPLPSCSFELVAWKRAKVHRDCHVVYRGELYSVPWRLVGRDVDLRIGRHDVSVYHDDDLVCNHVRGHRGKRTTIESHLPEGRSVLRHRSREHWERLADDIGPDVGRYVRAVFGSDDVLSKLRVVQGIVTHLQAFPRERANAACVRAMHYGAFSLRSIKDILRRALDLHLIPGEGKSLSDHWKAKPRFSRVPTSKTLSDEQRTRPGRDPEEAAPVRRPRDDGLESTAGVRG